MFGCNCGERRERRATPEERKILRSNQHQNVHRIFHAFQRQFCAANGKFKYEGYEFRQLVRRWAKRYPQDVRMIYCDDSTFCSSALVFIEHRAAENYMGTTVIYIPQFGGAPAQFFLYPSHRISLSRALRQIATQARPIQRRERQREKEFTRQLASISLQTK